MGLIEEIHNLKDTYKYNQEKILDELKSMNKEIVKHENEKISVSDMKTMLKGELFDKLYNLFDNNKGDFYVNGIEICFDFFKSLENRLILINLIGQSEIEKQYLNQIFDTTLKKVYKLFSDDRNYKFDNLPVEEQNKIRAINMQASMTQALNEYKDLFGQEFKPAPAGYWEKKNKKKANKHGFITFLNLILSPWGK